MAIPVEIVQRTVTYGPETDFQGNPITGTLTFTPSQDITWVANGQGFHVRPITVGLNASGSGSVDLICTDQAGFRNAAGQAITNWYYTASADLTGVAGSTRNFLVPTGAGSLDLDTMIPITTTGGVTISVPVMVTSVASRTGAVVLNKGDVGLGNVDNTSDATKQTALATTFTKIRSFEVSAVEFGLTGAGDETVALQAFVDYLTTNSKAGVLPHSNYTISAPIDVANKRGWALRGMGRFSTVITQTTDNVPIFNFGVGGEAPNAVNFRDFTFGDMCLTYTNTQPSTNTNANCIKIVSQIYESRFHDIYFQKGFYGFKLVSGQAAPWGNTWDDLMFGGSMTGGVLDWAGGLNAVPNNKYGRIYISADNMVGPIFNNWKGYNTTVDTIEILNCMLAPQLMVFGTAAEFIFGAVKLERADYSAASGKRLIDISGTSYIEFGEFNMAGDQSMTPTSGQHVLFTLGSGGTFGGHLSIGRLKVQTGAGASGGLAFLFGGTLGNWVSVRSLIQVDTGWQITNSAYGGTIADGIEIDTWKNEIRGIDTGDAALTVVPGTTENHIRYETVLTAPRIITLPSAVGNMIGGMTYRVTVLAGVPSASNTLTIKAGSTTLYTDTTGGKVLTFTWRRGAAVSGTAGWLIFTAPILAQATTGAQIDVFLGSGTWTNPAGAKTVRVYLVGSGAGSGSGRRGAAGTVRCGGGGGGGGAKSYMEFQATSLTATVAVTLPTPGTGGAAVTTDDTDGNPGTSPSLAATFGGYLRAGSGTAGIGGTASLGTGGAAGAGVWPGTAGGTASPSGLLGGSGTAPATGASGGGGGGGITSANIASAGGASFSPFDLSSSSFSGGAIGTTPSTPANRTANEALGGIGGPGGGSSITGVAGSGAPGSLYGAGGGGGGASLNGNNSGAGGNGAAGICVVVTIF